MASKGGKRCWVISHHVIWLCFVTVRWATSRRGEQQARGRCFCHSLFGSSSLPLSFLCLCFPFVSFFFFNLLFFPPNDGEKNNKRTQIAEEQNEGSLESFDSFSSFLSSFSFFHFVKLGRVLGNLYLFRIADGGTNLR